MRQRRRTLLTIGLRDEGSEVIAVNVRSVAAHGAVEKPRDEPL